jgi:hypothetical protein
MKKQNPLPDHKPGSFRTLIDRLKEDEQEDTEEYIQSIRDTKAKRREATNG